MKLVARSLITLERKINTHISNKQYGLSLFLCHSFFNLFPYSLSITT